MNHKRDGLVPIAKTFSGLPTPEKALRNASPQSLQHFTRFDPVNRHLCLYALTGTNLRDPLGFYPDFTDGLEKSASS